jgi:hypothetical protein
MAEDIMVVAAITAEAITVGDIMEVVTMEADITEVITEVIMEDTTADTTEIGTTVGATDGEDIGAPEPWVSA